MKIAHLPEFFRLFFFLQKEDPLKRIQAEISEVEKRERELREKKMLLTNLKGNTHFTTNDGNDGHSSLSSTPDNDPTIDSVSAFSDDSGISSSSSPVNGQSTNTPPRPQPRYIRSNTVQNAITASTIPNVSMMSLTLNRTMSTPQMFTPVRRFNINPARKGIMQRFIATRGKIAAANAAAAAANNNDNANGDGVDGKDATDFSNRRNNSILVGKSYRKKEIKIILNLLISLNDRHRPN